MSDTEAQQFKVGDFVEWKQPTFGEISRVEKNYFEVTFWTEDGSENTWSFDWDEEAHLFRQVLRPGQA